MFLNKLLYVSIFYFNVKMDYHVTPSGLYSSVTGYMVVSSLLAFNILLKHVFRQYIIN